MDGPSLTKQFEGLTLTAKPDHTYKGSAYVIGYGHDIPASQACLVWTEAQADAQFEYDYAQAIEGAEADIGFVAWERLDEVRQAALADMAFEMGEAGLHGFPHMLAAITCADWQTAHDQCLASDYAKEVPHRANAIALMLLTGAWPS